MPVAGILQKGFQDSKGVLFTKAVEKDIRHSEIRGSSFVTIVVQNATAPRLTLRQNTCLLQGRSS